MRSCSRPSRSRLAGKTVVFRGDVFPYIHQIRKVAGQCVGFFAHFRQHRAERDRCAHRLERILRPHHQRRRRLPADALQRGEDFGDGAAAVVERFAERLLPLIERRQTRPRGVDIGLDVADFCGGVDELLIELAAVLAQHRDFGPQLELALRGIALAGERRIEVLIALL